MKAIFYHSQRDAQIGKILPEDWDFVKIQSFGNGMTRVRNLIKLFYEVKKGGFEFILVDSNWIPLWVCVVLKKLFGIKIVLRLRGDSFIQFEDTGMFLSLFIERIAFKKVDFIITVSSFLRDELLRYGMASDKIFVLNTFIEQNDLSNNLRGDDACFLFVTDFHYKRKVMLLPEVINALAEIIYRNGWGFKIFIVGQGYHLDAVRTAIDMKWENIVVFTGYSKDVSSYYRKCKIFYHFSMFDAFPTVILEALSFGVPVIANDYGSNREMIDSGYNGFIVENDGDLERHAMSLVTDEGEYLQMKKNALESTKKWAASSLTMRANEIFSQIIANKPE